MERLVTIAVIPARAGSERIPGKNQVELGGRPLVSWTIEAALNSNLIDEVYVSSDDVGILDLAEALGAKNFGLRTKNFESDAPSSLVSLDVLLQHRGLGPRVAQMVVQLLPTSPFRSSEVIDEFLSHCQEGSRIQSAMSVFRAVGANLNWQLSIEESGRIVPASDFPWSKRSQDLPERFLLSGAIWAAGADFLRSNRRFQGAQTAFLEIPWLAGFEIDEPRDLDIARRLLSAAPEQSG